RRIPADLQVAAERGGLLRELEQAAVIDVDFAQRPGRVPVPAGVVERPPDEVDEGAGALFDGAAVALGVPVHTATGRVLPPDVQVAVDGEGAGETGVDEEARANGGRGSADDAAPAVGLDVEETVVCRIGQTGRRLCGGGVVPVINRAPIPI